MLRALIVDTRRRITPFGDAPWDAAFAGRTVGDEIKGALARRNIPIVDANGAAGGAVLVLADHTFVSDACLAGFLASSAPPNGAGIRRLALPRTAAVDFMRPVSSASSETIDGKAHVAYDCFLVDAGALTDLASLAGDALLTALRARAQLVSVANRERSTVEAAPITAVVAAHIEHWVHILWLNQLAFGIRRAESEMKAPAAAALRAFFSWLPGARSFSAFVQKGNDVRIHPTAHVEDSILGDGVVVGARARVRNSVLADGVEVADHAMVVGCSLGARTFVTPRTFMIASATYADAVVTNYRLQASLLGKKAALSTWAGLIEVKRSGFIEVRHNGKLVSTERSYLGSCVGHGAFIGAKVLITPGHEIPNDTFVAMRPDELIVDVPRDLPAGVPLVRDRGTLIPFEKLGR